MMYGESEIISKPNGIPVSIRCFSFPCCQRMRFCWVSFIYMKWMWEFLIMVDNWKKEGI